MSGKQEADMMGQFPNVSNKQVTLANWRTSPFNQWAFQHFVEQMLIKLQNGKMVKKI